MSAGTIKTELINAYRYRTELHAHTSPASGCSEIPPEEMVRIYTELEYDAVVITNHFLLSSQDKSSYIEGYLNDYDRTVAASEGTRLRVILGAEIRFTENNNDYLIYGIDRADLSDIYDLLPYGLENFRKHYPAGRWILLQAHPFRHGMEPVDPSLLDGMEVFNMHPSHNSRIALAANATREHGFTAVTAGSDFHHRSHEGTAAMRTTRCPKTSFDVADMLREGDYLLEIGRHHLILP